MRDLEIEWSRVIAVRSRLSISAVYIGTDVVVKLTRVNHRMAVRMTAREL